MARESIPQPGYVLSMLQMKCPRCRRGPMFKDANTYRKLTLKHIFDMPVECEVCHQKYDMEPGFWYGTGYVSYALTVAISVATFVAWWVLIGVSINDNRIFYWLGFNAFLLLVLQPWLMRLSRVIYIRFFVSYDANYANQNPKSFE
jgi:hypothetical protein